MAGFTSFRSKLIPIIVNDIDTDQIIPARFLKVIDKKGLGKNLFYDWRYLPDGKDKPDFILNHPDLQDARILVAGDNFGCGSSREHAPWALVDWGFRAVVSTSFADIFKNNALKNGLVPIEVAADVHAELLQALDQDAKATAEVSLDTQTLTLPSGKEATFPIDPFQKRCLLEGMDELGYILSKSGQITQFEQSRGSPAAAGG